jgi:hypothetical protein
LGAVVSAADAENADAKIAANRSDLLIMKIANLSRWIK